MHWGFLGGCYEIGEEPAETVMREIHEETGLTIRPTRLVGVYGGERLIHSYTNGDRVAFIDTVFVCEIINGELDSLNIETDALRFVSPDDLPEPFIKKYRLLIDHALNRSEPYFAK